MTTHGKRHAKQDIMDAAWKLFTEQGYDETTISQIIELSGKSRSTFYHHFRGKDELLFSLAYSYDSDYRYGVGDFEPYELFQPTDKKSIVAFSPATGRFQPPICCSPSTILC